MYRVYDIEFVKYANRSCIGLTVININIDPNMTYVNIVLVVIGSVRDKNAHRSIPSLIKCRQLYSSEKIILHD